MKVLKLADTCLWIRPTNVTRAANSLERRLHCAVTHPLGSFRPCCDANIQQGVVRSCSRCDKDFCFTVMGRHVPRKGHDTF
ncbi:hypothetical protein B0T18DRAFT_414456 [Schizothecium vesticola]|uniref:Uncharacterized protein n=1 Tax=Schizothecium vesticola TaxID=314040 RepID=A0AA40EPI8_9PEZI|nr:hypothetical protein B0T18DRAFT_414456 [Schizothecium vesticola]